MAVGGLNTKGSAISLPAGGELFAPSGATAFWIAFFVRFPAIWTGAGLHEDVLGFSGNSSSLGTGGNDRLFQLRPYGGGTNYASTAWTTSASGVKMVDSADRKAFNSNDALEPGGESLVIFGRQITPAVRTFRIVCPVGGTAEVEYFEPSLNISADRTFDYLGSAAPADDYAFERLGQVAGEFPAAAGEIDLSVVEALASGSIKAYDDPAVLNSGSLQRYYGLLDTTDNTDQVTGESIDMNGVASKPSIAPWVSIQINTKTRVVAVGGLGAMALNTPAGQGEPATPMTVTSQGVDVTFADTVGVGEYANGDKYIYDVGNGITVTGPVSSNSRDGMMLNIAPGDTVSQGFDSRLQYTTYDANLNIATQLPYSLQSGDALVVAKSFVADQAGDDPHLEEIAVFVIEDAQNLPPANSFRPNFYGPRSNRVHRFTTADLNWNILGSYAEVAGYGSMTLADAIEATKRPYMEYQHTFISRYSHAFNNQSPYGREIANDLAGSVILLNSDFTTEEKTPLFIQCVQNGLDAAGAYEAGQIWFADGGHNLGRKTCIVLAAAALNDATLVPPLSAMQDDAQIFAVDQAAVDITQSGYVSQGGQWNPDSRDIDDGETLAYEVADIGTPEWGIRHLDDPTRDNAHLQAIYRGVNGAPICRTIIAVNMFGGKALWGNNLYFDYADRFESLLGLTGWDAALWTAYRSGFA